MAPQGTKFPQEGAQSAMSATQDEALPMQSWQSSSFFCFASLLLASASQRDLHALTS